MRRALTSATRAALQDTYGERVPQIVQTGTARRPPSDTSFADQPVEGLLDRNVAQRQATRVDEHRIILRTRTATGQIAFQPRCRRIMQRHQPSLPELGLAD